MTAYLHTHSDKPLTITDLCELVHVSRRTLQYCFEDVLGISPLKYMRISRLNAVRRVLSEGLKAEQTISLIAQQWGFYHPGQFAHDYTSLFGENPSATVARQKQDTANKLLSPDRST